MVIPIVHFMSVEAKLEMVLLSTHVLTLYMSGFGKVRTGTPILRRIPSKNTRIAKNFDSSPLCSLHGSYKHM